MGPEWKAVCTHRDSEDQVRAALERLDVEALNDARRQLRDEGLTPAQINLAAAVIDRHMADRLDAMVANIRRDMALSAGEI